MENRYPAIRDFNLLHGLKVNVQQSLKDYGHVVECIKSIAGRGKKTLVE